jgi:hypothetical protein
VKYEYEVWEWYADGTADPFNRVKLDHRPNVGEVISLNWVGRAIGTETVKVVYADHEKRLLHVEKT